MIAAYCVGLADKDSFDYIFMGNMDAGDANHAVGEPLDFELNSFAENIKPDETTDNLQHDIDDKYMQDVQAIGKHLRTVFSK